MGVQMVPHQNKVNDFRALLGKLEGQLALALPKHIRVERMMRICLTTVQRIPALLDCTQASVLGSILQAAQLGLEPDGILGEAYLIPYKGTCQLICGYKGLLKLARNSGQISTVYSRVVREKDVFKYAYGIKDVLKHVPSLDPDPGMVTHVYAVAKLKDGGVQFEVMSTHEIEAIRKRSKAGQSGPWVTDWDEMAKKTTIRRLSKTLPASVELARAVVLDEQVDANLSQTFDTVLDVEAKPVGGETSDATVTPISEATPSKLDMLAAKTATPAPTVVPGSPEVISSPAVKPAPTVKRGPRQISVVDENGNELKLPASETVVRDGNEAAKVASALSREPGSDDGDEDKGDVPEHMR